MDYKINICEKAWEFLFEKGYKIGDELPLGVINNLMADFAIKQIKKCSIPAVVGQSEQFYCSSWEDGEYRCKNQCLGCAGLEE